MPKIVANFNIGLPGLCIVSLPEVEEISIKCTIADFEVNVDLHSDSFFQSGEDDGKYWTYAFNRAVVRVIRDEKDAPPLKEEGKLLQSQYLSQRSGEYGEAAREALNRIIKFFKYKLRNPFLQEFQPGHRSFADGYAKWSELSGNILGEAIRTFVYERVPGESGELSVKKLRPELISDLQAAMEEPIEPTLTEQILSDAQTAIFKKNFRRAVIELAIACEISVKRSFFSLDSPAGAAFDYLEDRSKVKVTVIEMIHKVALEAFGVSFKKDHPKQHECIDHLFRCRNKVAHRGELILRDDQDLKKTVDYELISEWWEAVNILLEWLKVQTGNL